MNKILATTSLLALLAGSALADSNSNSGVGNVINDSHNISGGYSVDSNNPSVKAYGGNSNSSSVSHSSSSSYQNQGQGQSQKATANNAGNSQAVTSTYAAQDRNPVSTAFAAPLAVGADSCMGSTSAGGQGVGFGLSLGTTWHDDNCERRHDAVTLHNLGQSGAALALMCQDEKVARAMLDAGHACPGSLGDLSPTARTESQWGTHGHGADSAVVTEYPTSARVYKW